MPFFGDPLTVKSRKPKGNAGSGTSRPKAIGYKGAAETKEKLQKLNSKSCMTSCKTIFNVLLMGLIILPTLLRLSPSILKSSAGK